MSRAEISLSHGGERLKDIAEIYEAVSGSAQCLQSRIEALGRRGRLAAELMFSLGAGLGAAGPCLHCQECHAWIKWLWRRKQSWEDGQQRGKHAESRHQP